MKKDLAVYKAIPILDLARRLDIEARNNKAMCFTGHDSKTPSLSFNTAKNTWKCFGACGQGGDTISLVMAYYELNFAEALKWLDAAYSVNPVTGSSQRLLNTPPRKTSTSNQFRTDPIVSDKCSDPEIYSWLISKCGAVSNPIGTNYLSDHGITNEIAEKYSVREINNPSFAYKKLIEKWGEERLFKSGIVSRREGGKGGLIWRTYGLLFPFFERDKIKYIQGRMFSGPAKYINLTGVESPIYNINRVSEVDSNSPIFITEGIPDTLALESCGFHSVAVLGANAFKREWVRLFMRKQVFLIPDGDDGGRMFKERICEMFRKNGKHVDSITVPEGMDVASFVCEFKG